MKAAMILLAAGLVLAVGSVVAIPAADAMGCVVGYSSDCLVPIECVMQCCTGYCCYPYDCADP